MDMLESSTPVFWAVTLTQSEGFSALKRKVLYASLYEQSKSK